MLHILHFIKYAKPSENIVSEILVAAESDIPLDDIACGEDGETALLEFTGEFESNGYELQGVYTLVQIFSAPDLGSIPDKTTFEVPRFELA